jgi:CBS domain-containing protein
MQSWQVRDVMTRRVVTATIDTPVGKIARLLSIHRISAVPIVDDGQRVLGVVSETDLLPKIAAAGARSDRPARRRGAGKAAGITAGDVMTTRPLTVPADAPLSVAAMKMEHRNAERLLVTGEDGRLLGVAFRADVLRPLTRSDTAIRDDVVEHVLRRTLWIDPNRVHVDVNDGVVTLTGTVGRRTTAGIAVRLTGHVAGVASVVDRLDFEFDDTALARSRVSRTHPFSAEPFHPRGHARSAA